MKERKNIKRLLYLTRKYPPSIGGMQRFNQKLSAHLRKRMDLRLISWGHSQTLMPFFLLLAFCRVLVLGKKKKIDLIYLADALMSPLGVLFKKLLNIPVVASVHGRDIAFSFPGYLKIVSGSLRKMDRVICVSESLKNECRRRGVPEKILRAIPNGVESDDLAWEEEKSPAEYLGYDLEGRTVLITVGRLVPKKGVDRFVEEILPPVVRKEPNVLYLVVGDGPLRKKIEALVKKKGLRNNVMLPGDIPMDSLRLKALYNCADIFVMPNVLVSGDIEGFGIVALEAAAAGLPVVASSLQGIREAVVDGKNGILLPWDDPQAFVKTILELIADPERRKKLGEESRRYVEEHYGWDKIASRYRDVFEEIRAGDQGSVNSHQ